jgi:hypothetical protein
MPTVISVVATGRWMKGAEILTLRPHVRLAKP